MSRNGDGIIRQFKTWERCVTIYEDKVIKRELYPDELRRRRNGGILNPFWAKERLQNEAVTIQFVAKNTKIPVPQCQLYMKDELVHLETMRIKNGVPLEEMGGESRLAAVEAVDKQLMGCIIPQLPSFSRNYIGSVDPSLPVFPPQRG